MCAPPFMENISTMQPASPTLSPSQPLIPGAIHPSISLQLDTQTTFSRTVYSNPNLEKKDPFISLLFPRRALKSDPSTSSNLQYKPLLSPGRESRKSDASSQHLDPGASGISERSHSFNDICAYSDTQSYEIINLDPALLPFTHSRIHTSAGLTTLPDIEAPSSSYAQGAPEPWKSPGIQSNRQGGSYYNSRRVYYYNINNLFSSVKLIIF
ncbi:uncharacterized protein LOC111712701 [Eurytemora carolleeae]|uniref:uncharacterized protein LOC111712701 n=1 Tax=Eurytemora carolleeae TaxID=1294199 RepID=UPI000C7564B8|nr:uncharacterized protein LOC111712701 [Eurytemora carolleeae]|eukprot:XP_023343159.1 uncharacterized protein LOC111712701 [Eurytemora affinis]